MKSTRPRFPSEAKPKKRKGVNSLYTTPDQLRLVKFVNEADQLHLSYGQYQAMETSKKVFTLEKRCKLWQKRGVANMRPL